jgi:hypothetical protein
MMIGAYSFLSIVTFIITSIVYLCLVFHMPNISNAGTVMVSSNISDYGFGTSKNILIIDLTDIGSADSIDRSDKKFATLTWGSNNQWKTNTIGIELKGDPRPKLNLAFEFWEPKDEGTACTSVETCDDDKVEMFDFGDKYEDYVLNGGFREPTLLRDDIASRLHGGILKKTFVEVLFRMEDKYTYEGVYLLFPAIQRRFLEKTLDWPTKGKAEDCDDKDYDSEKVAYMLEHTTDKQNGKSKECPIFKKNIKMRYPKCDFYDKPEIESCRAEYIVSTQNYVDLLHSNVNNNSIINLQSFANTYLIEMLMRDGDWPYSSQYFYVNPGTRQLFSGPHWDYDRSYWRFIKPSWDIANVHGLKTMTLWTSLGHYPPFIHLIRNMKSISDQNTKVALNTIEHRKNQYENGFFDRDIQRWHANGKFTDINDNVLSFAYDIHSKNTFISELDYIKKYFETRGQWISNRIETFQGFDIQHENIMTNVILQIWPWWGSCLLMILAVVYDCVTYKKTFQYTPIRQNKIFY